MAGLWELPEATSSKHKKKRRMLISMQRKKAYLRTYASLAQQAEEEREKCWRKNENIQKEV